MDVGKTTSIHKLLWLSDYGGISGLWGEHQFRLVSVDLWVHKHTDAQLRVPLEKAWRKSFGKHCGHVQGLSGATNQGTLAGRTDLSWGAR